MSTDACDVTSSASLSTCGPSGMDESEATFRAVATRRCGGLEAMSCARERPIPEEQPVTRVGGKIVLVHDWFWLQKGRLGRTEPDRVCGELVCRGSLGRSHCEAWYSRRMMETAGAFVHALVDSASLYILECSGFHVEL